MKQKMVKELLLQALEHEMGGVKIYEAALKCVVNEDLRDEWERYYQETETHVQILRDVCNQMQIDPEEQTPGRKIVHDMGMAYVAAMEAALGAGDDEAAQRVAAESVTLAELTDHANWELIGQ
jgi:rubrerythrin